MDTAIFERTIQTAESAADGPPILGVQAQLTFVCFVVVMTVVPWLLSRPDDGRPDGGARERRLWAGVVVVLAAIFATLGPAAEAAAFLRQRNLLRVTTGAVLAGVAVAILVPWVRRRPSGFELGAGVAIVAVYVTTLIRIPVVEARSHLFEYGVVAMLLHAALAERRRSGRRVPAPMVTAVVATALVGWLDEGVQALLPNRTYDLVDVGFNALAAFMAVTAVGLMAWARRLGRRLIARRAR